MDEVPIRIENGSKKIILTRQLDKEGIEGEHGLVIGIRCKKRHSSDPSVIIPVRIIITDANDHTPQFIGTPYLINVSEVTVVGTTLIPNSKISAIDGDQEGPFSTVKYFIEPGPYSNLIKFENSLDTSLILTSSLDYETLPEFWVVIRAEDQGEPANTATTTLNVFVQDADDQNPRFSDDHYTSVLPAEDTNLLTIKPKAIHAFDPDLQINSSIEYSFNGLELSEEYSHFSINHKTGAVHLIRSFETKVNFPITLVIKATQTDNKDRYTLTTLIIMNNKPSDQSREVRFLQSNYTVSVFENVPIGHTLLSVQTTRSLDKPHKSDSSSTLKDTHLRSNLSSSDLQLPLIEYQLLDNAEEYFQISQNGDIFVKKPLDYETVRYHLFRVLASDDKQSDVTRVNISLINVNDNSPQFDQIYYQFYIPNTFNFSDHLFIGQVNANDNDVNDKLSFSVKEPFCELFTIDDQGRLSVSNLSSLNSTEYHFIVIATDSGLPPRSASTFVTLQVDSTLVYLPSASEPIDNYHLSRLKLYYSSLTPLALIFIISFGVILASFLITTIVCFIITCHSKKSQETVASTKDDLTITGLHSLYLDKCFASSSYIPSKQFFHSSADHNQVFHTFN